jgi:uncharacterized protein (DUF1778 family)
VADVLEAERLTLSERDSLRVIALLENPPAAPARLVRAAEAGFRLPRADELGSRTDPKRA